MHLAISDLKNPYVPIFTTIQKLEKFVLQRVNIASRIIPSASRSTTRVSSFAKNLLVSIKKKLIILGIKLSYICPVLHN